uniref:Myb/SANT-like DNA-binding domain-containing protein n=1 Tax=Coturnix japonica TaxID=93934 RepID=A0A8C2T9T8_COTJA
MAAAGGAARRGLLKRKPNFTLQEIEILMSEVLRYEPLLFGAAASTVNAYEKQKIWWRITNKINAAGRNQRDIGEVKNRWRGLRRRANDKITRHRQERQGPAPRPNANRHHGAAGTGTAELGPGPAPRAAPAPEGEAVALLALSEEAQWVIAAIPLVTRAAAERQRLAVEAGVPRAVLVHVPQTVLAPRHWGPPLSPRCHHPGATSSSPRLQPRVGTLCVSLRPVPRSMPSPQPCQATVPPSTPPPCPHIPLHAVPMSSYPFDPTLISPYLTHPTSHTLSHSVPTFLYPVLSHSHAPTLAPRPHTPLHPSRLHPTPHPHTPIPIRPPNPQLYPIPTSPHPFNPSPRPHAALHPTPTFPPIHLLIPAPSTTSPRPIPVPSPSHPLVPRPGSPPHPALFLSPPPSLPE